MSLANTLKKVFRSIFPMLMKQEIEPNYFVELEELLKIDLEILLKKLNDLKDFKFILQ